MPFSIASQIRPLIKIPELLRKLPINPEVGIMEYWNHGRMLSDHLTIVPEPIIPIFQHSIIPIDTKSAGYRYAKLFCYEQR
jgi:hypothetical protein